MPGQDVVPPHAVGGQGPLVQRLLARFCERNGLKLDLDEGLGNAGFIQSANGHRSFFVGTRFSLNPQGSAELARDKAYSLEFLGRAGLPTPGTMLIASPGLISQLSAKRQAYAAGLKGTDDALRFAATSGYPVFVKPNDGQEGKDVCKAASETDLEGLLDDLFTRHDRVLVQEAIAGKDLRIVVLDDDILCGIERTPLQVMADGQTTIKTLVGALGKVDPDDRRVVATLHGQGFSPGDVAPLGTSIDLLPAANLSSGGTGRFLDEAVPPHLSDIARRCGRALGLRYYAVDMIVSVPVDGSTAIATILEVNAAPGFAELHRQSAQDAARVEAVYEKLFQVIAIDLTKA